MRPARFRYSDQHLTLDPARRPWRTQGVNRGSDAVRLDFDRVEQIREAGRSYDRVAGNFVVGKDAQPPRLHVRRRDEDLWPLAFSHRLKIDEALDQFFKPAFTG